MGFSEDLLETAMKIGLKTIEIDAAQLIERKRSINETWNDAPVEDDDGEELTDLGRSEPKNIKNGIELVEKPAIIGPPSDWEPPSDHDRTVDDGERPGQWSETSSIDASVEERS
jgi:hypothetical protein